MRDCLSLVDGGFAINSPFPLSLLPQRVVDLIVSFDYSLDEPFKVRVGVFYGGGLTGCLGNGPLEEGLGPHLQGTPQAHCAWWCWCPRSVDGIAEVLGGRGSWERRLKRVLGYLLSW